MAQNKKLPLLAKYRGPILTVVFVSLAVVFVNMLFRPHTPDLPKPAVKDIAAVRRIEVGALADPGRLDTKAYTDILTSQFAFITSDNELHWDKFRPSASTYNYKELDKLVNFAAEHNMGVQGHHLVWNEDDSLPRWLKNGHYDKQQLLGLMQQHISNTMVHYRGKINEWTVVNEPFTRARHIYGLDNWWGEQLGGNDYIDKAFRWAREANQDAKLILNDFYNETASDVTNDEYAYLKAAKERGVPIDGVGMQMHIDATRPPSKASMVSTMQRFGALGYPVYVTEFNVHAEHFKGTKLQKQRLEARITQDVVSACVQSSVCVSFNVFGVTDTSDFKQWVTKHKEPSVLFTSRYQPKPAFNSFRAAWQQE